jgi:transcription factor SPN1
MPIDTFHLRNSRLGRVVRFYTKCDRVTPHIRKLADELIRKWMRPILGKSSDFKHKKLKEARYDAPRQRLSKQV